MGPCLFKNKKKMRRKARGEIDSVRGETVVEKMVRERRVLCMLFAWVRIGE